MKVLLDPVYTASPTSCSTSYLVWQVIERLSAARDDAFFLLMVPEIALQDEEQAKFLTQKPDRVKLVPYNGGLRDRMREMWTFPPELADVVHPASQIGWDVDAVVSSRIHQLAMFRFNSARRQSYGNGSLRTFIGLEEMPMFQFSKTVAWHETEYVDAVSLANYMAADNIVLSSFWARARALEAARATLAPSKVRKLASRLHEASPVMLEELNLKEAQAQPSPLNVVFCGRAVSSGNFAEAVELFQKQFAYPLDKGAMEFLVSTNSSGVSEKQFGDMSMISVEKNGREAFYEFLDKRAHVAVNPSPVNDFSLSTYEMLLHGVPVILYDKDWTQFLGPDYPFRAGTFAEAYAYVNDFAKDYAGTYARFEEWANGYWKDFVKSQEGIDSAEIVTKLVLHHEEALQEWLLKNGFGETYVQLISATMEKGPEKIDLNQMLKDAKMQCPSDLSYKNVVGRTPIFQVVKQLALAHGAKYGYKDTLETGIIAR